MAYDFILRYYIDPGFAEDDRIGELVGLCRRGKIAEVMFFYNPEELFQGYPSAEKIDEWFALAKKVKSSLDEAGIRMSVNPWTTTVHISRGRRFSEAQKDWNPLVGETGMISPITACPLDRHWQKNVAGLFARMAKELHPTAIWIEDDWRLHNHEPGQRFGGCFCQIHREEFARRAGLARTPSVETLVKNLTAPGKPHPWRKIWLGLSRDTLIEPAEYFSKVIHKADPSVRLGLMSSSPDTHSVEGRDWEALSRAFEPAGTFLVRPHLPPYTEQRALQTTPSLTRLTIANYSRKIEVYPELENSPRCGLYSKSGTYSAWEMLESVCYGSRGITINHYDMMGNGLSLDPSFPSVLARVKPQLDAVAELGIDDREACGIDVYFNPKTAETLHCRIPGTLSGLIDPTWPMGDMFYILGISHRYVTAPSKKRLTAVCAQQARALSDGDIRTILSSGAFLDARAAEILLERGWSAELGIRSAEWLTLDETGFAYEEIPDGTKTVYGLKAPRMSASRCSARILKYDLLPGAKSATRIMRFDKTPLAPGFCVFRSPLGGTVVLSPYPTGELQFFMGFFNHFRRIFLQNLLIDAGMKDYAVALDRPLNIHRVKLAGGKAEFIGIVNPTQDAAPDVRFRADRLPASCLTAGTDGIWKKISLVPKKDLYETGLTIPPYSALYLKFG